MPRRNSKPQQRPITQETTCKSWADIVDQVAAWAADLPLGRPIEPLMQHQGMCPAGRSLLLLDIDNTIITTSTGYDAIPVENGAVFVALQALRGLLGNYDVRFLTARYASTQAITLTQLNANLQHLLGPIEAKHTHYTGGTSKGDYILANKDLTQELNQYSNIIFVDDLDYNTTDVARALTQLSASSRYAQKARGLVVHYTMYTPSLP